MIKLLQYMLVLVLITGSLRAQNVMDHSGTEDRDINNILNNQYQEQLIKIIDVNEIRLTEIIQQANQLHQLSTSSKQSRAVNTAFLLDSMFWYTWSTDENMWKQVSRSAYLYDDIGREKNYVHQLWYSDSAFWRNIYQRIQHYTKDRLSKEALSQEWIDDEDVWRDSYKSNYTYNSDEFLLEESGYKWSKDLSDWKNHHKTSYTYDNEWLLALTQGMVWDDFEGDWSGTIKDAYSYNEFGQQTAVVHLRKDLDNQEWRKYSKIQNSYNDGGLLAEVQNQEWNQVDIDWIKLSRILFQYDAMENCVIEIDQNWGEAGHWINNWRLLSSYDTRGNKAEQLRQQWDNHKKEWINAYRYIFEFDDNNNWIASYVEEWVPETGQYVYQSGYSLFYSIHEAESVNEINTSGINSYPNPCSSQNTIELMLSGPDHVKITLSGSDGKPVRIIADEQMSSGQHKISFDVSALPAGLYFIKIQTSDISRTGKLMVVR